MTDAVAAPNPRQGPGGLRAGERGPPVTHGSRPGAPRDQGLGGSRSLTSRPKGQTEHQEDVSQIWGQARHSHTLRTRGHLRACQLQAHTTPPWGPPRIREFTVYHVLSELCLPQTSPAHTCGSCARHVAWVPWGWPASGPDPGGRGGRGGHVFPWHCPAPQDAAGATGKAEEMRVRSPLGSRPGLGAGGSCPWGLGERSSAPTWRAGGPWARGWQGPRAGGARSRDSRSHPVRQARAQGSERQDLCQLVTQQRPQRAPQVAPPWALALHRARELPPQGLSQERGQSPGPGTAAQASPAPALLLGQREPSIQVAWLNGCHPSFQSHSDPSATHLSHCPKGPWPQNPEGSSGHCTLCPETKGCHLISGPLSQLFAHLWTRASKEERQAQGSGLKRRALSC